MRLNPYNFNRFVTCPRDCEKEDVIKAEIIDISRNYQGKSAKGLLKQIRHQLPDTSLSLITKILGDLSE